MGCFLGLLFNSFLFFVYKGGGRGEERVEDGKLLFDNFRYYAIEFQEVCVILYNVQ